MSAFYSETEIQNLGFISVGKNVLISKKASIYGITRIKIGNNVRIDDYCVLSAGLGGIEIGNYIHIAVFTSLIGQGKITIEDFANISSKVAIYSSNDDYSGKFMTNPTVPSKFTNVTSADVFICKHVIIGSGSIILPGVTLNMGVAIGALSLVKKDCEEFSIYIGSPAKKLGKRDNNLLYLENEFMSSLKYFF